MALAGVKRGLAAINKHVADEEAKFNGTGDGTKAVWFKLDDKQQAKVVFLQELDPDSPNFSEKNDLGFLAVEHVNPADYRRKALCTADEGECYGCIQHRKDYKAGWKQKTKLYINVLVDNGIDEPFVAVLSQGNGPKSITPTLIEYAGDDGTISDKFFTIKRNGLKMDTSYTLRAGKEHGLDVESYELFDLEKVVRQIPFAEQQAHYEQGVEATSAPAAESAPAANSGSGAVDAEW